MNFLDNMKTELMWSIYGDPKEKRDSFYEKENFSKTSLLNIDFSNENRAVGIDISKWDVSYKRDSVTVQQDFVIMRTSYGLKTDEKFMEFLPEVMKAPIKAAYHYMSSWNGTWKQQADYFLNLASKGSFDFLVVDFESAGGNVLSNQFVGMTVEFAKYCQTKSGKKVVLYTGGYLFRDWIMKYQPYYSVNVPLWIAQYPYIIPDPQVSNPLMLKEIKNAWLAWQYSGDKNNFGKQNGVGTNAIDVNVFNGSVEDMKKYFGITNDTPPVDPPIVITPPTNPNIVKVNSNMNIREGAGTKYKAIGSLPANSTVEILEYRKISENEVWARIDNSSHWICLLISGKYYSDKRDFSGVIVYVEPPITTNTSQYYRLLHDFENLKWNYESRVNILSNNDKTKAYPETVRFEDMPKGTTELSPKWVKFLDDINTESASVFLRKKGSGWLNNGAWPQVEQLTFAGNTVEVTSIVGNKAYIKCYYNDDDPPVMTGNFYDPSRIHYFTVVRPDGKIETPPIGNVRTLVIVRDRSEKPWIPLEYMQKVDKLEYYIPPPIDEQEPLVVVVPTDGTGLYTFADKNYTYRRESGPLILSMSKVPKIGDKILLLNKQWQDFVYSYNNSKAIEKIKADDFGPSQGVNSNGFLKYIGALWPGRNIVKIDSIVDGSDGEKWGLVKGISFTSPDKSKYNLNDNPELIHTMFGGVDGKYFPLSLKICLPIIGNWYIPMSWLVSVDSQLPKKVTIKASPNLNIRNSPYKSGLVVGNKPFGVEATVTDVKIGSGGIWGKISEGWIALRYNDINYTSWQI